MVSDGRSSAFQSTHPVRGATSHRGDAPDRQSISIHAPREGCDQRTTGRAHIHRISIHAPREGCDPCWSTAYGMRVEFQSTHPVRGATLYTGAAAVNVGISIHAPREGCDRDYHRHDRRRVISIHAPREGCDGTGRHGIPRVTQISIHAPREGCDRVLDLAGNALDISIHAPREGCDVPPAARPLRGLDISIHAPREGCDRSTNSSPTVPSYFNPRTP